MMTGNVVQTGGARAGPFVVLFCRIAKKTMASLSQYDPEVGATIENEYHREQRNIELIASERKNRAFPCEIA